MLEKSDYNRDAIEQIEVEHKLKIDELKYGILIENLPQKIFLKDKDSVYISCNNNYARDLKIKAEDITGKTDYDFYPKELAEKYRADDKRIINSGKTEDIEEEYIENGKRVYVHTVKTPIKGKKGNNVGLLGIFWDITERKKAEKKIVESNKFLNDVIEAFTHPFYVVNAENYKIELANSKVLPDRTFGVFPCYSLFHKREKPCEEHLCPLKIAQKTKQAVVVEHTHFDKNGKARIYEVHGHPILDQKNNVIQMIEYEIDITERKKAERKLKESENILSERVKELTCLYELSTLIENPDISLGDIIQGTLKLIPPTWRYPEITCARIIFDKFEFQTRNFKETEWKLSTRIRIKEKNLIIEIYYLEDKPFLKEEKLLLKDIGKRLRIIIEQKEAEFQLKESEQKFKSITEESLMGICIIQDNLIKYANRQYAAIGGYTSEEMMSWQPGEFIKIIHPEDREMVMEQSTKKQKGFDKVINHYEFRALKKTGETIWVEIISNSIIYNEKTAVLIRIIDITEKKKAELKLKESEEKYRSFLENIKEGYFEIDLNGYFTFFNDGLCESIGYSRGELINMHYGQLFNEEKKEIVSNVYDSLYKAGEGFTFFECEAIKKDNNNICIESSVYLKHDNKGNIIGFKGFARNITERKSAEVLEKEFNEILESEVLKRTKELNNALKQQKLYLDQIIKVSNFKSDFLATMSHELRTPLNAIIGFSDLLLKKVYGPLNNEQIDFLSDIKTSSKHLLEMISRILDISKIEAGELELNLKRFSLNSIVDQINSTIKPLYKKKELKFKIRGLDSEKYIYGDPIKFKEILLNLLSNAIKFTISGTISLVIKENYKNWIFKIRDPGIGIDSKDYHLIFKEFKRVDSPYVRSTPGTGLGLSLTKRLVNLHYGEINFTSMLGVGTEFTFTIPKKIKEKYSK